MNGHPRDQAKVSVHCRWPLIRGNLTLKCVGRALITWPYKAGGRSRRGSPKAGTTVYIILGTVSDSLVTEPGESAEVSKEQTCTKVHVLASESLVKSAAKYKYNLSSQIHFSFTKTNTFISRKCKTKVKIKHEQNIYTC